MPAPVPDQPPRRASELDSSPRRAPTPRPQAGRFDTADIAWERCQERAAQAFVTGNTLRPRDLWARALQIAEERFDRSDPRLATSLTNQALVLRRLGQAHQAQQMFEAATQVWDDSWLWVRFMTPPHNEAGQVARGYEGAALDDLAALAARGKSATLALADHDRYQHGSLDLWLTAKPAIFSDLRRLLGAVLLIVSKPPIETA